MDYLKQQTQKLPHSNLKRLRPSLISPDAINDDDDVDDEDEDNDEVSYTYNI